MLDATFWALHVACCTNAARCCTLHAALHAAMSACCRVSSAPITASPSSHALCRNERYARSACHTHCHVSVGARARAWIHVCAYTGARCRYGTEWHWGVRGIQRRDGTFKAITEPTNANETVPHVQYSCGCCSRTTTCPKRDTQERHHRFSRALSSTGKGEARKWPGVYLHDDTDQRGDDACSSVQQRSAAILTPCTVQLWHAQHAATVRPTI